MNIKTRIKRRLGEIIRSCLAADPPPKPCSPGPKQILMEWRILERVLMHFEQRRQTWEQRGSDQAFKIGNYFEFGCYNGDSLVDFYNVLRKRYPEGVPDYWKMFVFDSFEGLPATELAEDLHPHAGEGSYKSEGMAFVRNRLAEVGCDPQRLTFVKGFYEQSLTKALRDELIEQGVFASFVNLDCDYYSSTKTVLDWIEPLLTDGAIVYFDDIYFYNCNPQKGQLRSIKEFNADRTDSGLALAPFFDQGARCYMYWRNDATLVPKQFEFEAYVTG